MVRDILLVVSGAMIGTGVMSLLRHFTTLIVMRKVKDDIAEAIMQDMDELLGEIKQFGYEVYERQGKMEMRKASSKRGRPKGSKNITK